jgi:chromosome segregation ATPase
LTKTSLEEKNLELENFRKMVLFVDKNKAQVQKERARLKDKISQLQDLSKGLYREIDETKLDLQKADNEIDTIQLELDQKDAQLKLKDKRIAKLQEQLKDADAESFRKAKL